MKKWEKDYVLDERIYEERDERYVFRSIWDNFIYNRVKKAIEAYTPERTECLMGTVIFSSNGTCWEELLVTSEVLARLAEQNCTVSAYRISRNWYLVDQINHENNDIVIK